MLRQCTAFADVLVDNIQSQTGDLMDDNFNNMNNDVFQQETGGISNEPVIPVVSREKKDDIRKMIIVMCLVCALVGSIIGGVITGFIMRSGDEKETMISAENNETTTKTEETTLNNFQIEETTVIKDTETETESGKNLIQSGTHTSSDDKPSENKVYSAKEIYKNNVDSVVSIEVRSNYSKGYGTGFIISEEGYIVTNYHVVDGAKECYVTLYDDSVYTARIVGYEESNDIAVIKIEPEGKIQSLVYGNSSELSVGDSVYVIGNPLGDLTFTLTNGVVSALNRLIETGDGLTINMFQTNAAVNSGNSGGPVFDEHGYVVGIASAKYASSSIEGLSFCIPIDDVRSMIDEIINKGYVSGKPLIGISACDREVANYGFIQSSRSIGGVKVVIVGEGSAAEKYGLQTGDIITYADGKKITKVTELKTILAEFRSGETISFVVNRNGVQQNVSLVLDEYEPTEARTNYSYVYDL